jgi:hypothetical protein
MSPLEPMKRTDRSHRPNEIRRLSGYVWDEALSGG